MSRFLIRNRAKCLKCGDVIESKSRHDYVECSCGAIAVDGGLSYLHRAGDFSDIEEMSQVEEVPRTGQDPEVA